MVADSPDGKVARPQVLMNSPRGIRYMVRDRMLEARRHEGGTETAQRGASACGPGSDGQPHPKANQHVAQHAQEESAVGRQIDLGVGQSDGDGRNGAPAYEELA